MAERQVSRITCFVKAILLALLSHLPLKVKHYQSSPHFTEPSI